MTTPQTVVVVVLWITVGGLLGLVLLLYRSVERAYRQGDRAGQGGLLPGAEAPAVEILTGAGVDFLEPLALDSPYLLGFVSGDCDECTQLLDTLIEGEAYSGRAALVLIDGIPFDRSIPEAAAVEVHPAAHPPDIQRGFGLSMLPLLYVMQNRTVLAVGPASTHEQLQELLEQAHQTEAQMDGVAQAPADEPSLVGVATAGDAEAPTPD